MFAYRADATVCKVVDVVDRHLGIANVDEILADFYDKAFGPGAAAMKRYYERLAPDHQPLISRELIGAAFRDVEEAARLAKDRPDVQARLDQIKHYLRYVHLRWLLDHEKDRASQKDLTVAADVHEGSVVQFHLRDAETSADDLDQHLRAQGNAPRPAGALLFSCLGRGRSLYGTPDHDSRLFLARRGDVPVSGFFCNGEIGPVGGKTHLHGYTSSFALFRPRRDA